MVFKVVGLSRRGTPKWSRRNWAPNPTYISGLLRIPDRRSVAPHAVRDDGRFVLYAAEFRHHLGKLTLGYISGLVTTALDDALAVDRHLCNE